MVGRPWPGVVCVWVWCGPRYPCKVWMGRLVLGPETEDRAPGSGPLRTTVLEVSVSVAADGRWRGLEVRKKAVNPVLTSTHWGRLGGVLKISLRI